MTEVRIKASRQPYRRAGLEFSSADWVLLQAADISPDQQGRLVADPVLTIEVRDGEEAPWVRLNRPGADRAAALEAEEDAEADEVIAALRQELADRDEVHQRDLASLRAEQAGALEELQKQLTEALAAHQAERDQLVADHQAKIAELKAAHVAELAAAAKPAEGADTTPKARKETRTAK